MSKEKFKLEMPPGRAGKPALSEHEELDAARREEGQQPIGDKSLPLRENIRRLHELRKKLGLLDGEEKADETKTGQPALPLKKKLPKSSIVIKKQ